MVTSLLDLQETFHRRRRRRRQRLNQSSLRQRRKMKDRIQSGGEVF